MPCIPNPEAEVEAGGSSEDKDGSEGRKKKNRWVSPFESFKRLIVVNYIFLSNRY